MREKDPIPRESLLEGITGEELYQPLGWRKRINRKDVLLREQTNWKVNKVWPSKKCTKPTWPIRDQL